MNEATGLILSDFAVSVSLASKGTQRTAQDFWTFGRAVSKDSSLTF